MAVPLPEGKSCFSPPCSPAVAQRRSSAAAPRGARGRGAAPQRDPAHRAAAPESLSAGYVSPLSSLPPLPFPVYLSRSTHTRTHIFIFFAKVSKAAQQQLPALGVPPAPGQPRRSPPSLPPCPAVLAVCAALPVPTQPSWVASPLGAGGRGDAGPTCLMSTSRRARPAGMCRSPPGAGN